MSQWSDSERGGGEGLHSLKLTPAQKGDFVRASTMREREGDTAKWGQSQYRYRQFLIETQRASDPFTLEVARMAGASSRPTT